MSSSSPFTFHYLICSFVYGSMTCWVGLRAYMENWWLWNSLSLSLHCQQQVGSHIGIFQALFWCRFLSGFSGNFSTFASVPRFDKCHTDDHKYFPILFWYHLHIAFLFFDSEMGFWGAECALLKPKVAIFSPKWSLWLMRLMIPKLLVPTKVHSVLVNIRDNLW